MSARADLLRRRVVEAGRLAVRTLGTTPWRLTGDGAERCSLDGERGMRFGWTAGGPPSDDVVRDGEAVAAAYRDAGFDVRTQRSADGVAMRVVGTRADVGVVELDAATDSTAVDVGSVCIAGDPLAYNRTATPSRRSRDERAGVTLRAWPTTRLPRTWSASSASTSGASGTTCGSATAPCPPTRTTGT